MHGARLLERRARTGAPDPQDAAAIDEYLAEQRAFQAGLLASLRGEASAAAVTSAASVARNSELVWTWDVLSLALALDWAPYTLPAVPTADGECALDLAPGPAPARLVVDPWPFRSPSVAVRCDGRRLATRYDTDRELSAALADASWETLELTLEGG
jgi:hypothetical protein